MTPWLTLANEGAALVCNALWRATWQGGLAVICALCICRLAPSLPAPIRCWLWRLAYLKVLVALFWIAPISLPILPARPELPARWSSEISRMATLPALNGDQSRLLSTQVERASTASAEAGATGGERGLESPQAPSLQLWLVLAWAAGVLACARRVSLQWRRTSQLRGRCAASTDPGLARMVARLARKLGLRRIPEVLFAPIPGPLVLGAWRPAIVLPEGLHASEPEREWILAHELAHVKRHDLLWAHLPVVSRVLLFFHPLLWLGHREWRLAQEMACDALTLRLTQVSAGDYGELLVRLASCQRGRPESELSVARILEPGIGLERRLKMLPAGSSYSRRAWMGGGALVAVLSAALAPWQVAAQPTKRVAPSSVSAESAPRPVHSAPSANPGVARTTSRKSRLSGSRAKRVKAREVAHSKQAQPIRGSAPNEGAGNTPASAGSAKASVIRVNASKAIRDQYLASMREAVEGHFQEWNQLANLQASGAGSVPTKETGFRAVGITYGPASSWFRGMTPAETREFLQVELRAVRSLMEIARARYASGQATMEEVIPLEAQGEQTEILLAAVDRLAGGANPGEPRDLFQSLTPRELMQYLAVELKAARRLLEIRDAQFQAGTLPASELLPLTARMQQLEILLRVAERRAAAVQGGK